MGSSGVGTSRWSCMRSSVTVYICTCFFFKATPIWNKWLSNWENYSFQISIVSELLFDKQKNVLSWGLTKFVNQGSGHIRLSVSTVNHTNELSGITRVGFLPEEMYFFQDAWKKLENSYFFQFLPEETGRNWKKLKYPKTLNICLVSNITSTHISLFIYDGTNLLIPHFNFKIRQMWKMQLSVS